MSIVACQLELLLASLYCDVLKVDTRSDTAVQFCPRSSVQTYYRENSWCSHRCRWTMSRDISCWISLATQVISRCRCEQVTDRWS